jgi:opacity protein-like surface antigen
MRLITCVAVAILLIAVVAQAAEVPTSAGDKAMIFRFKGLDHLSLRNYHGDYGIGMRYYLSDGMALRGGVILGKDDYTEESDTEGYADEEWNDSAYGLEAVLEMHMEGPCASVSPYYGVGAGFESWKEEHTYPINSQGDTDSTTDKGSGFRVFGALGFEWGFTNCMTLGGEYQLGFTSYSIEPDENNSEYYSKATDTIIAFDTASMFLSVYW